MAESFRLHYNKEGLFTVVGARRAGLCNSSSPPLVLVQVQELAAFSNLNANSLGRARFFCSAVLRAGCGVVVGSLLGPRSVQDRFPSPSRLARLANASASLFDSDSARDNHRDGAKNQP